MATNREKYINNASNEELAILLANKSVITCSGKIDSYTDEVEEKEKIEQWLSQEASDDK